MQQHLRRLDGVASVDVRLLEGKIAILPKEDARLDPLRVIQATFDSGVSVIEMSITGRGRFVRDPARGIVFRISPSLEFEPAPGSSQEQWAKLADAESEVTLRGRLFKKTSEKKKKVEGPLRLEVLEILKTE